MPTATEVAQEFPDDEVTTDDDTSVVDDATDDDSASDDSSTDDDANNDESDEADETEADDTVDDKKADDNDDDDGFFADEDDEDDTKEPELPTAPASFSPEDKYIIDNLPLISVRVIQADDSIKTLKVRSAADLPRDMKGIATPYEDKQFDLANVAQETRARELQTYYRQHQATLQSAEFEKQENLAIRDDVAELQRQGEIPKFKAQPGTKAFDDDPGAKVVNDTIQFMNERNAKYLEKSNSGGAFRRIGFADAFELMKSGAKNDDKNSSSRKEAAKKLVTGQGSSANKGPKAPVSGKTIAEVAREFEDFEN